MDEATGKYAKKVPFFRETSKKGPFWGKYLFSLRNYASVENDPNLGKEMLVCILLWGPVSSERLFEGFLSVLFSGPYKIHRENVFLATLESLHNPTSNKHNLVK